jgi:hypothetical protein
MVRNEQIETGVDYFETIHIQQVDFSVFPAGPHVAENLECEAYSVERQCLGNHLSRTFRVRLPFQ